MFDRLCATLAQRGFGEEVRAQRRRTDDGVRARAFQLVHVLPLRRRRDDGHVRVELSRGENRQRVLGVVVGGGDDRPREVDLPAALRLLVARIVGEHGVAPIRETSRALLVVDDDEHVGLLREFFENRFRQVPETEYEDVVLQYVELFFCHTSECL